MRRASLIRTRCVLVLALIIVVATPAAYAQVTQSTEDLRRLPLEALLDIDVETVSRGPEPVRSVPAAIYVITSDDIERSGATSIPEALRLAPGIQVARINAGTWAVGMRGLPIAWRGRCWC